MSNQEQLTPDLERGRDPPEKSDAIEAVPSATLNISPVPTSSLPLFAPLDGYTGDNDSDNEGEPNARRRPKEKQQPLVRNRERDYDQSEESEESERSQRSEGPETSPEARADRRKRIWAKLKGAQDPPELEPLSEYAQLQRLSELAASLQSEQRFEFFRFERLALLNLQSCQHNLIKCDETLQTPEGQKGIFRKSVSEELGNALSASEELGDALKAYCDAIRSFETLSKLKRPDLKRCRRLGPHLTRKLNEPRYWEFPDALNLIDLTPDPPQDIDRFRRLLQRRLPAIFLDRRGRDQRDRDLKGPGETPGDIKLLGHFKQQPRHLSPVVDKTARLAITVMGSALLLVPMVVLAFVEVYKFKLLVTVLFVLFFSVLLALTSRASNQELLGATAAYVAVLVVYVAGSSPSS